MTSSADPAASLLPCLKERKWIGRERTVCRALWEREPSAYMPWLATGYDHPHTFEFIDTTRLAEMQTTERALEREAIANLARRPASWRPLDVDLPGGKRLHMLICTDDFFAAERIVDGNFMRQAERTLKARALLVGIPRRGLLMAIDGASDQQILSAFGVAVAGQFSRAESAIISPMLFAVKDGAIVGILDEAAEACVLASESAASAEEEPGQDGDAPYISAIVSRNDRGSEDVHLVAAGHDAASLAKGIESAFMHVMKEHAARREFSGHTRIVVLGVPASEQPRVSAVVEHLRGVCSELSGAERRYEVSLTYEREALGPALEAAAVAPPREAASAPAAGGDERSPATFIRVGLGILLALMALSRLLTP